jgi:hypothetical protein
MKLSLLPLLAQARLVAVPTLLLLAAPLVSPLAVVAQSAPPKASTAAGAAKPATVEEVNTYMTMSAINLCALSQQKVPFKAAMDGSVTMVASVLTERHGSLLVGSTSPLSREQIINAIVIESVLRSDRFCGTRLPADWRKEYDTLLAQIRKSIPSAGAKPPASK